MPTEPDPIANDLGHARRARDVAVGDACVLCGRNNPEVLKKVPRSLLEGHHTAGKANHGLTVTLCLNCHREQTARQRGIGLELDDDPARTSLEKMVSILRGAALFFEAFATTLVLAADELAAHIRMLDADFPQWRENDQRG